MLFCILVSSWCTTAYIAYTHQLQIKVQEPFILFDELYDKPWTRIGPYIVGMCAGWFLAEKRCKISIPVVSSEGFKFKKWTKRKKICNGGALFAAGCSAGMDFFPRGFAGSYFLHRKGSWSDRVIDLRCSGSHGLGCVLGLDSYSLSLWLRR